MKNRILSLVLCLLLVIGVLSVTAFAATTIDNADIMISHPAHLANPETFAQIYGNCQMDTTYNSDGFQNGLRWKEIASGKTMGASDTFVGGKQYELSVLLISKTGYAFSASATTVTVNGDPVSLTVLDVNRAKASITLTADNLYINYVTLTGLEAPKVGNTPDYSASVQEDTCNVFLANQEPVYNGIFWIDKSTGDFLTSSDKFVAGHVYVAGVYVQAKAGYEFPRNIQATVTGATRTEVQVSYDLHGLCEVAAEYPALADSHTHTPSAWRTTGAYHYKACTTCGDFLEQEDHKGGVATCSEQGKCTVCDYAYIEENDKHDPDTAKWTACGKLYHAHLCKLCGAHCDTQDHVPGPEATETAPQKCTVCDFIITPVKNHTHDLKLVGEVAPGCATAGSSAYYACSGCSERFRDVEGKEAIPADEDITIPAQGHKLSNTHGFDGQNHWYTCAVCKEAMEDTKAAHEMKDGKCQLCGYTEKAGTDEAPSTGTEFTDTTPAPTDSQTPDKGSNGMPWWGLLLIGLVAVTVGVGGGVLILSKKKKE